MPTLRKLLFAIICLLILTLAGWLGARYWLRSFLASEECRVWLGEELSAYTGGEVQMARLQPESLDAIYSEGASLNQPSRAISLKADQLRANVRIQLFSRFCQIDRVDVTRVRLVVGEAADHAPSAAKHSVATATQSAESTERFVIHEAATADFNALWPGGSLAKSAVSVKPDPQRKGAWTLTGQNGTVRLHQLPQLTKTEWRVEELQASLYGEEFRLVNASLRTGREGSLSLQGSVAPEQPGDWTASFSGLPVETVADGDWRARLKGGLSGRLRSYHASPDAPASLEGRLEVKEGEITTLPVLDALATLTGVDRFRQLPLHQASTRLSGSIAEGFTLSELVMESSGLVRIEGELKMKDGMVTGTVQLGLTPAHVGRIPGGRTVFASEKQGYLWTPVALSGPVVSPSEDLSARLVRAAAGEVMGQATSTLRKGAEGAREATKGLLDAVSPLLPVNPSSLLPALPDVP